MDRALTTPPYPQTYVVGIDPGVKGAVAVYDTRTQSLVCAQDMPVREVETSKRSKNKEHRGQKIIRREVDLFSFAVLMDTYALNTKFVLIEDVASMPNDGAVAAFRFGHSTGGIHGVLTAFSIQVRKVKPAVWKTIYGLSHDKDNSRVLATEKFPGHAPLFARKKDDGRAEAALLALFGAERFFSHDKQA